MKVTTLKGDNGATDGAAVKRNFTLSIKVDEFYEPLILRNAWAECVVSHDTKVVLTQGLSYPGVVVEFVGKFNKKTYGISLDSIVRALNVVFHNGDTK